MKKVVFLVAALLCCTSSVFAWNAESFTNGSVYEYEPVMAASTFSLDDGVAVASTSASAIVDKLTWDDMRSGLSIIPLGQLYLIGSSDLVSFSIQFLYPDEGFSLSKQIGSWSGLDWVWASGTVNVPSKIDGTVVDSVYSFFGFDGSDIQPIFFDLDISSLGDFSSFSLSGSLQSLYQYKASGSSLSVGNCSLALYVNGSVVKEWPGISEVYEMSDFIFSSSVPITSISFALTINPISVPFDGGSLECIALLGSSNLSLSVLRDDAVLDGFNDQAQDSINEHESVESQWTGSMTENFNSLDLEDFTFPNGLISAFALITGIFNDLWNALGEYKILFVFPLCLGIVLLLIGRISKFDFSDHSGGSGGSGPPAVI